MMTHARWRNTGAALCCVVAAVSCGQVLGLDDFEDQPDGAASGSGATTSSSGSPGSSTTSSTTSSAGGTSVGGGGSGPGTGGTGATGPGVGGGGSGGVPIVCDQTCIPEVPVGWTGPMARYEGTFADPVPACAGAYGDDEGTFFGDMNEGVASCNCNCAAATGIQCTTGATICTTNNSCVVACLNATTIIPPGVCTAIAVTSQTNVHVSEPAPTNMGGCTSFSNHQLPTAQWQSKSKVCGGAVATPGGCGAGEVCAPAAAAPFDKQCIVHAGDVACPATGYTEPNLEFESFTDNRACSQCSCGAASSQCNGKIDFTNSACNLLITSVASPGCGPKNSGGSNPAAATYGPAPTGTCPPAGGVLSGAVSKAGAITICCQP